MWRVQVMELPIISTKSSQSCLLSWSVSYLSSLILCKERPCPTPHTIFKQFTTKWPPAAPADSVSRWLWLLKVVAANPVTENVCGTRSIKYKWALKCKRLYIAFRFKKFLKSYQSTPLSSQHRFHHHHHHSAVMN